jgi:hypothetical protein
VVDSRGGRPQGEVTDEVIGQLLGVGTDAVDEGGAASSGERHAEDVEARNVEHSAVVDDAAAPVEERCVDPRVVGTIASRPHDGADASQRDLRGCGRQAGGRRSVDGTCRCVAYYAGAAGLLMVAWMAVQALAIAAGGSLPEVVGLHVAAPLVFAG